MKYVSLDLETTGLDPLRDQILQLAMVIDDLENPKPLSELPKLNLLIQHDRIEGNCIALDMNASLIKKLAGKEEVEVGMLVSNMSRISGGFYKDDTGAIVHTNNPVLDFLYTNFKDDLNLKKITVAGKNVTGFDIPFLPKTISSLFSFRAIDVGSMYVYPTDTMVPSMSTCLERAGLPTTVTHYALDDALQVVELIRHYFKIEV